MEYSARYNRIDINLNSRYKFSRHLYILFISSEQLTFLKNDFHTSILKIWNICPFANWNFSLLHTIHKLPDIEITWSRNLCWEYFLVIKVVQLFFQLGYVTFPNNFFLSVNCSLSFRRPNFNFIVFVEFGISSNKLHAKQHFQEKSCDHIHGVIY